MNAQLLDGISPVFPLAAQAGVRKSWGREFGVYMTDNVDAPQTMLEDVGHSLEGFGFAPSPLVYRPRQRPDMSFRRAGSRGIPGAVYNIGGGSRVSLLEVFDVMRDTYADTRRACADLGFAPTVTLEQGLRAQRDWMAEVGA